MQPQHIAIIGPRKSGQTTLALLMAAHMRLTLGLTGGVYSHAWHDFPDRLHQPDDFLPGAEFHIYDGFIPTQRPDCLRVITISGCLK